MSVSARQTTPPPPAEVWSTGDYAGVCDRMIPGLGARLVELAGVQAGEDVLDVATGSGNAALPAARAGARVTALDITPALLEVAAQRATTAGLDVEWVHGDAQALPFGDASFDRVLSCVGVQFCANHEAAAAELARVCRPGGRIALIAWTREGFIGQILAAVAKATGGGGSPRSPLDWGSEDKLSGLFGDQLSDIAFHREHVEMPAESSSDWVDYMATAYGPLARARAALQARAAWEPLRARLIEIADAHDAGGHAAFTARAEYLAAVLGTQTHGREGSKRWRVMPLRAFKMKVSDEVLARVSRAQVASAELDEGKLLSHLTIAFTDGAVWQFDIPKQGKNAAKSVVRALGGAIF